MRHIQKYRYFLAMCALFIVLSACSKSESQSLSTPQDAANYSQQIEIESGAVCEPDSQENLISTTLTSGVEVKAYVDISNHVDISQLAIYDAEIAKQDYALLKQLLLANKDIVDESSAEIAEARTDSLFHYCVTSDGSSLAYSGEGFSYDSGQYSLMQNILNPKQINVNEYSNHESLSFSSREDAQQNIENIIEQLNLEVEESPICYSISFESLQDICEKLNASRRDAFGEGSPLYTPFTCSATDACYIFIYQLSVEGLPISTRPNGVFGDGSWTSGTSLYCFYTEKGMVGMELPYTLQLTGQASKSAQGLSISQVLEKVDEKFNSMILSGDYIVTNIEFEYVPMPSNGSRSSFSLLPAWRITVSHTYQFEDTKNIGETYFADEIFDVVFHAFTGEELLSSSGSA